MHFCISFELINYSYIQQEMKILNRLFVISARVIALFKKIICFCGILLARCYNDEYMYFHVSILLIIVFKMLFIITFLIKYFLNLLGKTYANKRV